VCRSFHAEPDQKDYRAVGDEVVPGIDFLSLAKGYGVEGVSAATAEELKQALKNWGFPQGMADTIAAGASDLAMVDIIKIGSVTGWLAAMAQAEAAALPFSNFQTTPLSSRARK
jgi:hypothetical protein